jgi:glucan biosynthesis protein C
MTNKQSLQATGKSPVQAAAERTSRLFFIDHLRVALAILVVLHHVAIVYGAVLPMFYYLEPPFSSPGVIDPLAYLALMVFSLFNQAWFMGAFFLLAGYFMPGSFDRKGPATFLKDKLVRLGIPLVVFCFVLNPVSWLGLWLMPATLTGITTPPTWQTYLRFMGLGPLWFVAMLLIFSFGYAAWRMLTRNRTSSSTSKSPPGYLGIGIFVVALAAASYLVRMIVPIGKGVLDFPTLAYLPQYLGFFIIGTVASRRNWIRRLPGSMGVVGLVAVAVTSVLLFPLAFSGQWFSLELTEALNNAMGNGHWRSAVYALWDAIMAVGMCLGLIHLFRRFFNGQGRFGRLLSQQSYAVYVIHIPLVVVVAYLLQGITIAPLAKFGLASLITVPVCFAAAYIVRKIPFVSKVL